MCGFVIVNIVHFNLIILISQYIILASSLEEENLLWAFPRALQDLHQNVITFIGEMKGMITMMIHIHWYQKKLTVRLAVIVAKSILL